MTEAETGVLNGLEPTASSGRRRGPKMAEGEPRSRVPDMRTTILWAILVVAMAAGSAYAFSLTGPVLYGARAEVLFEPDVDASGADAGALAASREVIAGGQGVLEPVARQHGMTPDGLRQIANIEPVTSSNVIRFTVSDPEPERARVLAQALAEQYIASMRPRTAVAAIPVEEYIREQIEELTASQAEVEGRLGLIAAAREIARQQSQPLPYPPEEAGLAARSAQLQRLIGDLYQRLIELELDSAQLRLLTPAYVLDEPVAPKPLRAAAAGVLGGLLIASGMVVAITQRRTRDDQDR